ACETLSAIGGAGHPDTPVCLVFSVRRLSVPKDVNVSAGVSRDTGAIGAPGRLIDGLTGVEAILAVAQARVENGRGVPGSPRHRDRRADPRDMRTSVRADGKLAAANVAGR